nr:hypothetical protein Iba_chr12cCG21830 [Ipomoea batatas]
MLLCLAFDHHDRGLNNHHSQGYEQSDGVENQEDYERGLWRYVGFSQGQPRGDVVRIISVLPRDSEDGSKGHCVSLCLGCVFWSVACALTGCELRALCRSRSDELFHQSKILALDSHVKSSLPLFIHPVSQPGFFTQNRLHNLQMPVSGCRMQGCFAIAFSYGCQAALSLQ